MKFNSDGSVVGSIAGGIACGLNPLAVESARQQQQFSMIMRGQQEQYVRLECLKYAVGALGARATKYSEVLEAAQHFYEFVQGAGGFRGGQPAVKYAEDVASAFHDGSQ